MNRCLRINLENIITLILFIYFIGILVHISEKHFELTKILRQVKDPEKSLRDVEESGKYLKTLLTFSGN